MTPIASSHTQLTSTITLLAPGQRPTSDQAVPAAAGPNFPLDWLEPIPPLLARCHRPELIQRLALRMRAAALNPIQVELWSSYRRIQILQTTVVEFGPEGWLSAYAWEMLPGGRLLPQARPLSFVSAEGAGHEGRWRSGFAQGFMLELRRHHYQRRQLSRVQDLIPAYVLWVMSRLSAHLAQTMKMAPMHQVIERVLLCNPYAEGRSDARRGLNAAVLALAKKRFRLAGHPNHLDLTLKDYQDYQRCLQNTAY